MPTTLCLAPSTRTRETQSSCASMVFRLVTGAIALVIAWAPHSTQAQGIFTDTDVYGLPLETATLGWQGSTGSFELLPLETLYPAYLAGPKESRLGTQIFHERDEGLLWDTTLGGRLGLLRGSRVGGRQLWQVDLEGAAILRLDPEESMDLQAVDFRAGMPIAIAWEANRIKLGYYHLSAHLGDEFLIKDPSRERLNYVRDALVFAYSRYLSERVRIYGEASWAFYHDVGKPWQFQLGYEYAPTAPTGARGAPFFAINAQLREEVDFGGTTTVHTGWAWRDGRAGRLLRAGFFFQTGKTHLYEFYDHSETQIGTGIWYDF